MDFGRILTAMVTPFNSQDELDLEKVEPLVEHLINNGTEGLVVAGTTGESPTMTKDEKLKLFENVAKVVNGRIPVLAGTGSNSTKAAAELTKEAEATGVDGIMLVTPYYNKPNARGLYEHFKTIAAATNLPIMLYNIPGRSAINMSVEVTVSLANIPNIVSIKDASGSLDMMSEIIHRTPDDFSLYSGDDSLTIPAMSVGANGIVSVASHVIGNEIKEMVDQFWNGNVKQAAEIHRNILPKMKACFMAPSPSPVKAALNHYGIEVGSVRLPLVELTEDEKNLLIHTIQ
ncbi:4-hydroxy-tetrahydrodipicolinate synthase [Halalkalibacillus sediminis]|uniref:4-hydroxy-tetrahydrodipicolinate synthase n=1 Tax=Halalkalibacillus sediminis TaxID=2018042 RepID=A0A2I0QWH9_9BACI|nr:4-hydroxy-tetrahydrodipicolinate synthase [Halalkalibacillus sediminis]PKR78675.1 4-hydroxy-tetrahydrodipicolinate synthase [Halalkalibacillus sediminis]